MDDNLIAEIFAHNADALEQSQLAMVHCVNRIDLYHVTTLPFPPDALVASYPLGV